MEKTRQAPKRVPKVTKKSSGMVISRKLKEEMVNKGRMRASKRTYDSTPKQAMTIPDSKSTVTHFCSFDDTPHVLLNILDEVINRKE